MAQTKFTVVYIGAQSLNKFWGEEENKRSAHATCTLLDTGDACVLVDPSPKPKELELKLYETTGRVPEDIDIVFLTHYHGDHHFGIDLFPDADWLIASQALDEWPGVKNQRAEIASKFKPAEGNLPEGVELYPSPGHINTHYSVRVISTWGRVIISGDAVMNREYCDAEEGFENAVDFEASTDTIRRIKSDADYIVPGHGNFFPT